MNINEIGFFDRKISNKQMYNDCNELFHADVEIKEFRNYINETAGGFGDDAHCIMWDRLVNLLPDNFKFIEIGVYKGQVMALVAKSAIKYNKKCSIYGVTPLSGLGDKYTQYDDLNYLECIINLHKRFNLPFNNEQIIKGNSTDLNIKETVKSLGMFDVIYIDGGHDYDTVVSDIDLAKQICKPNGYIVADDSSVFLDLGLNVFKGHKEVSLAVDTHLKTDNNFTEKNCVGHNRIFKKTDTN